MKSLAWMMAAALFAGPMTVAAQEAAPLAVSVQVDAARPVGELKPVWRFFGADEPNYATMKDGQKLLTHLGELKPKDIRFRAHNLLNTGDGTAAFKWGSTDIYTEDAQGRPIYNYHLVDKIIDSYIARGVRPYLQLGFMPEALSSAPKGTPYRHSWRPGFAYNLIEGAWNAPPKDYDKWGELIYQWTKHNVERYGRAEVETWYFEVWNEPNGASYWTGTVEEFNKMHDYAVAGVRRALPTARVGGPDAAGSGGAFMDAFLAHVARGKNYVTGQTGTPTDFLSFHAKGSPRFVEGHVRMGISNQLQAVNTGFAKIAAVPELKDKPIVIGESDPEGCAACPGPQNAYRNGTMYSSYTAASFARIWDLADRHKVNLEGVLTWAFTFEDQPWFAGYRQLATNGVDLPVLNVFRMFSMMGEDRLGATSDHAANLDDMIRAGVRGAPDVNVLASRGKDGRIAIMLWNYHDDDVPGPTANVKLALNGLGSGARDLAIWRVDQDNANAFTAWKAMGSPQSPDQNQYKVLEEASKMKPQAAGRVTPAGGAATIDVAVPRQGVALLVLTPA